MNDLEELKRKYEELGKEIERLEKEKSCKRWRAEFNNDYYYIDEDGNINSIYENNDISDIFKYKTRNYFKTEEEAEKYRKNLKTYYDLMDLAEKLNNGEKINWNDINQIKYVISFDSQIGILQQGEYHNYKEIGQIYCLNENFLEIALDKIGEEKLENLLEEE